jgi:hypothetical protein
MENLIKYNDDDTVNIPFGRVAEWYISNHSLLKNIRLKCQSRKKTSELVNEILLPLVVLKVQLIILNGIQKEGV